MTRQTSSTSGSRWGHIARSLAFVVGLVVLLGAVQFVVFARHDRDELWRDYRNLPSGSVDVLFLGTSLVHANINPVIIWEETGIRAYALSGSEQSLLTTLPYLREALRTQKPSVVALEVHMLSHDKLPLSENQKRSNLTMMPFGLHKLQAISVATPAPEWTRYLIPLEQFHSRWGEVERKDFSPSKWRRNSKDQYLGYRKVDRVDPQQVTTTRKAFDEDRYARNYGLISDIIETAQESGAEVLLFVGPSSFVDFHEEWLERLRPDIARDYPEVQLLETQSRTAEIGLAYDKDYYDWIHLNSGGAERYSSWLGQQLVTPFDASQESSDRLDAPWRGELARYRRSFRD